MHDCTLALTSLRRFQPQNYRPNTCKDCFCSKADHDAAALGDAEQVPKPSSAAPASADQARHTANMQ